MTRYRAAPPLHVVRWFNVEESVGPGALRGKVVLLHAFQMLCPACVELATPQAQRVHESFPAHDVAVIGLHTVFENHDEQGAEALARYIRKTRLTFPIGVDAPDESGRIPLTMQALGLDGTPTAVLIDAAGRIRMKKLGHVPDLELGAAIGALIAERHA
jgi:hypothetical protein